MRRMQAAAAALVLTAAGEALASELAGRIWAPQADRFVAPAEVERAAADARFVLLGEEHTIAEHHVLQARLLRATAHGGRPAVAFEMIPQARQEAIDAWREAPNPAPADLGPAVAWSERGWPPWRLYVPIVEAAVENDLPLLAGAPEQQQLMSVARSGLTALEPARREALRLDRALPEAGHERLLATLRSVHCGEAHAPATRMLAVQRLRDASMAERLRAAAARSGAAALIAGHGHTREDYGVPQYLNTADEEVVTIAFRGTEGRSEIRQHVAAAGGALPYDYVWFTEGGVASRSCANS